MNRYELATNTLVISASNLHSYLQLHALPLFIPTRYLTCKFSQLNIVLSVNSDRLHIFRRNLYVLPLGAEM
jgi:hypothetical protein